MGLLEDTQFVGAKFFLSQWNAYDSIATIEEFAKRLTKNPYFESHVCLLAVPFPLLSELSSKITHPRIVLGANAMLSTSPGTFTASISGLLLKKHLARFVLIGSAKSREIHPGESLSFKDQIKAALDTEVTPFYCVGETLKQQQEGQTHRVLLQQCKEGLSGLSTHELPQLCIVYEAPWMQSTPEILSLDRLVKQYQVFKQAVSESVDQDIFPNIKLIDALPLDIEEADELLEAIPDKGLYAISPEIFFSLLNEKCADKLKVMEVIYTPMPQEPQEMLPKLLIEEEKALETISTVKKPALISTETAEEEEEQREAFFKAEQKGIEEEEFAAAEQEEENALDDALKNAREMKPLPEEKVRQELEIEEEALGREMIADEEAAVALPQEPLPKETAQRPVEEFISTSNVQKTPEAPSPPAKEEEAFASASKGDYPMSILEGSPEKSQESQELQELQMKLQHLNSLDKSLADCYQQIHERMDALPALRETFPERLNKMTADLNKLDPALQEQINRGNIAFFTENPDKMREAAGVLVQIQEINLLLQKTAAIPRELDRILSKSREIRKALEAEWSYFRISRQRIKDQYPDFQFPSAPSQLMIQEPKTDITPMDFGPSGLISKRIAVVKAPPMPKQG